jgi:hypothetical protein
MTEKKISELAKADYARDDDIIIASTGLRDAETPATKKIFKKTFNMTEGGARVYSMIMDSEPIHYWVMEQPVHGILDEISGDRASLQPSTGITLVGGLVNGATRLVSQFPGTFYYDTGQVINLTTDITVMVLLRMTAAPLRPFGCNSANDFQGFGCFRGASPTTLTIRMGTGSGSIDITAPAADFPTLTPCVFVWTFTEDSGHVIYSNGQIAATSSNVTPMAPSTVPFQIGHRGAMTLTARYQGQQQDFAIWDRVLTTQEIEDISNAILGT